MASVTVGGGNYKLNLYGNNTIIAGGGNDTIENALGNASVLIGSGNDSIQLYENGTITAGSGNDTVEIHDNGIISIGGGNDSISLDGYGLLTVGGGYDTISLYGSGSINQTGFSGNDTINLGFGSDTITEAGTATVVGPYGNATVSGGTVEFLNAPNVHSEVALSGNATLIGGEYTNMFIGGSGDVYMKGSGALGPDTFVGGSGSDTMVGGANKNLFEFLSSESGGQHVINNFVSGQDQLYLEGYSLSYLQSQGDVTSSGGNTTISLDGGHTTIELKGVGSLSSTDVTTHK